MHFIELHINDKKYSSQGIFWMCPLPTLRYATYLQAEATPRWNRRRNDTELLDGFSRVRFRYNAADIFVILQEDCAKGREGEWIWSWKDLTCCKARSPRIPKPPLVLTTEEWIGLSLDWLTRERSLLCMRQSDKVPLLKDAFDHIIIPSSRETRGAKGST